MLWSTRRTNCIFSPYGLWQVSRAVGRASSYSRPNPEEASVHRSGLYRLIHPHTRQTKPASVMQSMAERVHATNDANNTAFSTHKVHVHSWVPLENSRVLSNLLCRTVLAGFTPAEQPRRPNVSGRNFFPFPRCYGFCGGHPPGLVRTTELALYPAKGRTEQTGPPGYQVPGRQLSCAAPMLTPGPQKSKLVLSVSLVASGMPVCCVYVMLVVARVCLWLYLW